MKPLNQEKARQIVERIVLGLFFGTVAYAAVMLLAVALTKAFTK